MVFQIQPSAPNQRTSFLSKRNSLIVFWVILILSIITVYIAIATEKITRYNFYNSDTISIPAMYNDVISGYSLAGWWFGNAPSLFPDLPLYFTLRFLLGNVHLAIMGYGVIQILLLVSGFISVSKTVFEPRKSLQALILLAGTVCCLFLATGKCPALLPMLLSSFHFGAALSLVISLALVLRILKSGLTVRQSVCYAALLFLVATFTLVSDAIYLVQFLIPGMLSLLLLVLFALISTRQVLRLYLSLSFPILFSERLGAFLFRFRRPPAPAAHPSLPTVIPTTLERMAGTLNQIFLWPEWDWCSHTFLPIFQTVWIAFMLISVFLLICALRNSAADRIKHFPVKRVAVLVLFGLIIPTIAILMKQTGWIVWMMVIFVSLGLWRFSVRSASSDERGQQNTISADDKYIFVASFFLFSSMTNIAAVLFVGGGEPRYFLPTMLIPLFFGWPFLIAKWKRVMTVLEKPYMLYALAAATLVIAVSSGAFGDLRKISSLANLSDYYPEFVRCLDQQTKARNIRNGMTQYWDAKYLSVLSKNHLHLVQVRQLEHGLFLEHLVNNLNWYNTDFEFVITEEVPGDLRSIWESIVVGDFEKPADTFTCQDKNGVARKVLVYNRPQDTTFQKLFQKYFTFAYAAADLPSETGQVSGLSRIANEGSSQKGYLTYGPYATLIIGDYTFEIHYYAKKSDDHDVGKWDVVIHSANTEKGVRLSKGIFKKEGAQVMAGEFKIRGEVAKTEIRTYYEGRGTLRIDKITIRRIR